MGPKTQNVSQAFDTMNKAYQQNLGPDISAILGQQQGVAQGQLAADQAVSPGYAALQDALYKTYGTSMNKTGADIANSNRATNYQGLNQLAGQGGAGANLVTLADQLQHQLDPNFYKGADAVGKGISSLLGGMDPNQLSGSELATVQRGLAQQPGSFTPSTLSTIQNASQFGNALAQKQARFGQAISQAAGALPSIRSGMSGIGIATGAQTPQNTGDSRFFGAQTGTGQNAWNFGNNLLSSATNIEGNAQRQQKSTMDQWQQGINTAGSFIGSIASAFI